MKRSKMIQLGRKALTELPRELERGIRLSANDKFMITSILLSEFIDKGMLPPLIEETVYIEDDDWIGNQDKYTPVFALQWEPEEE